MHQLTGRPDRTTDTSGVPTTTIPTTWTVAGTDQDMGWATGVHRRSGYVSALPGLAVFVAAGLIAAGRMLVTGWPFDRLWAEDGAVFLADALDHGWRSIGYSYAGYMHGLPRVLTLAGSQLPLSEFAHYAVVVSVVVCALIASLVFSIARRVTGSTGWAVLAGLATVTAPALRVESLGSLANLQWFLLYGALWLCLARPGTTRWWLSAGVAFVAAVTTPLTVALFPVVLLHRRRALRHPAAVGITVGLVVQACSRLLAPQSQGRVLDRSPGIPDGLARAYLDGVAGVPTATPYAAAAFGILLLLAGLAALGSARDRRLAAVVVALVGALLFVGTSVITNVPTGRYTGVGTLFLWGALALVASAAQPWIASVVGTLIVAAAVLSFPADPYLVSGPSWATEIARATAACAGPDSPDTVAVPLSPEGWGTMTLSCGSLR